MGLGVYIHFPYCRARCPYCDFAVHVARELPHQVYADAVLRELGLRAPAFAGAGGLRSVFFGGGTPSLWAAGNVAQVLRAVQTAFPAEGPLEVSLEANPDDLSAQVLGGLREAGINRLSIGVQSFDAAVLRGLGRQHSGETAARAIADALDAGFAQVSVDLIHGGPGHTPALARADAERAAASGVDHVSSYALTLDELAVDVPLAKWVRQGRVSVPDADGQADLGQAMRDALGAAGFTRYEVSNFARRGAVSRHNLGYWRGELPPGERDPLTAAARFVERVFLGLRLAVGLDLAELARDFGAERTAALRVAAERLRETAEGRALLTLAPDGATGGRLSLTERGLDLHSEVAARLT